MCLAKAFKEEWDKYILSLKHIGLRREQGGDKLTWNGTKMENKIKSREAYQSLTEKRLHREPDCWFKKLWKAQV